MSAEKAESIESLWSLDGMTRSGVITEEQRRRLEAILKEDPTTRRFYLEYLQAHFNSPKVQEAEEVQSDFWSLVELKFDGTMSPQQQQRFDAIMHNDASARRFYQAYAGASTDPNVIPIELWDLAAVACEGTITVDQRDRLEVLLDESDARRRFYVAYLDLHAQLRWQARGR